MNTRYLNGISVPKQRITMFIGANTRWAALLFITVTATLLSSEAYFSYRAELRKAAENADNLSLLLRERLTSDIRAVDTLLVNTVDTIEPVLGPSFRSGAAIDSRIESYIQRQSRLTPVVDNISIATADGVISYARVGTVGERIDTLPFFNTVRRNPDIKTVFSEIYESRATKLPVISLAHRLTGPGKAFGGLVAADLDVYYFQRLLQNINVGSYGSITLLHENGQLVSNLPEEIKAIGHPHPLPISVGPRLENELGWTAAGQFASGDERRMYSVRKLGGFPLTVVVGLSDKDFLATWRTKIAIHGMFILALMMLTVALERAIVRERKRTLELRKSREKLEGNRKQLQTVIETAPVGLAIANREDAAVILSNRAMCKVLGQTSHQLEGQTLYEFCSGNDTELLLKELDKQGQIVQREVEIQRGNGDRNWLLINATFIEFEEKKAIVIGAHDITERKAMEAKLMELATIDALTGLANRRLFMDSIESEFQRALRTGRKLSVLMIDIDRFKQINDGFGHATGDCIIQQVAGQVKGSLRAMDLAGRLGGDEFSVLLPETGLRDAMLVAKRICSEVQSVSIKSDDGQRLSVTVSIGVACINSNDNNGKVLLERADMALYKAKKQGRNQAAADTCGNENEIEKLEAVYPEM